jgi:hypothetical protein
LIWQGMPHPLYKKSVNSRPDPHPRCPPGVAIL